MSETEGSSKSPGKERVYDIVISGWRFIVITVLTGIVLALAIDGFEFRFLSPRPTDSEYADAKDKDRRPYVLLMCRGNDHGYCSPETLYLNTHRECVHAQASAVWGGEALGRMPDSATVRSALAVTANCIPNEQFEGGKSTPMLPEDSQKPNFDRFGPADSTGPESKT
jgi:hypothetical protein